MVDAYTRAVRPATAPSRPFFGGLIALNQTLERRNRPTSIQQNDFTEGRDRPERHKPRAMRFSAGKKTLRLLTTNVWPNPAQAALSLRQVSGGLSGGRTKTLSHHMDDPEGRDKASAIRTGAVGT